jgi:molybdate transport system ATP-binding protein
MIRARLRKEYAAARDSAPFSLDVTFEAGQGITAFFGPSGSGKTLTLDCIAGFVKPDEGRILLDDDMLFDAQTHVHVPPQKRRCGYVFQNYALFPHMNLRQNLAFAADRLPRMERRRKVAEMLEKFRLDDVAGRKPHELSGGQKQRGSIARALVAAPRLLLLDEPARGLDAPLRNELYDILRQVRHEFTTPILLVTHSLEECFELAEEMLIIRGGRLVQSGSPARICDQPASLELARLLGIFNVIPVEIRALDPSRNVSTLRYESYDLTGPYFPGRLKGDHVHLVIPPKQLCAVPRRDATANNQVPADLLRAIEMPEAMRLEFAGDLCVEMPREKYEPNRHVKEWSIQFPSAALRVV